MLDPHVDELRKLIAQSQELERRLRDLQHTVAAIRTDFEEVSASRTKGTDAVKPCPPQVNQMQVGPGSPHIAPSTVSRLPG